MKKQGPSWLWDQKQFYWDDWFEYLPSVGMFSEDWSKYQFLYCRWEDEIYVCCPFCNSEEPPYFLKKVDRWKCAECRKQFSLKTKTWLHGSNLGFAYWHRLCWLLCNAGIPVNSHFLARDLHVSQKTAWQMLKTISDAIDRSQVSPMIIIGEKDEYELMFKLMKKPKFLP